MRRVAITGPESSGKTTLAGELSVVLNAKLVGEFARDFLEERNGIYRESDLLTMARGQYDSILEVNEDLIVVDTDFIVYSVWANYKYSKLDPEIRTLIQDCLFDLHILCKPDIPWQPDPLRENPKNRDDLFELYIEALNEYGKNFIVVEGNREERLNKAIEAIELL